MKVLAISGSLRPDSYNTKLLRAAEELLPPRSISSSTRAEGGAARTTRRTTSKSRRMSVAALRSAIGEADARPLRDAGVQLFDSGLAEERSRLGLPPPRDESRSGTSRSRSSARAPGAFGAVWAQAELRKVLAADRGAGGGRRSCRRSCADALRRRRAARGRVAPGATAGDDRRAPRRSRGDRALVLGLTNIRS